MKLIGAGLGYRIDNAAGGTAIFSRKVRSVDLKLADRRLAHYVADAGTSSLLRKERLVIVAAVNRTIIQQPGNATETDQTKGTIRNCAGGKNRKVGPASAISRKIVQRDLIDIS